MKSELVNSLFLHWKEKAFKNSSPTLMLNHSVNVKVDKH